MKDENKNRKNIFFETLLQNARGGFSGAKNLKRRRIKKLFTWWSKFIFITLLTFAWIFSGWPQIWNFPPGLNKTHAGSTIAYKSAGAGTMTETIDANLTPAAPAAVDAGDILIAHIVVLDASLSLSTPSGWTLLFGPSGLGTTNAGGALLGNAWAYGRIADGSEDGATINFGSLASTVGRMGRIYSFSGYSSGTINDVVPAASFTPDQTETDPVIQQVTTTVSGAKAISLVSQDDNNSHAALGAVTGGTWAESVADYVDANVGAQGGKLQIQVGTPTSDPGTIAGGLVAGTDDEANTLNFEIRSNAPVVTLSGTATASITEADIVAGGKTIVLTTDGMYAPANASRIQFVGGTTAGKAGAISGDSTIALNSGLTGGIASAVAAGDLVIAVFGTGATADRTLAITDGSNSYTLIDSELYQDDTLDTNLRVAYKFMGGTPDASTTFGPTGNANDSGAMAVYVFRGVDSSNPLDVAAVPGQAADTSRVVPPDITPSTAGAYVVVVGAAGHNGGADTFTSTDLVLDFFTRGGTNDTNDVSIGVGHINNWTSGATDAATWGHSQTDSVDFSWAAITLALRPAATTPFADARQAIINGLDSAQSGGTGWDAVVKAGQNVSGVVRTSNTVVTITLDAFPSYDITAQETITATIPATALLGEQTSVATPTFTIDTDVSPPDAPTNVSATDGTYTDKVTITWTKSSGATGYKVYEGTNLLDTLGDVATYDDSAAPAPTITAGTSTASDGTTVGAVSLILSGYSANNGTSRTYKVVATNAAGDSPDSATDTGYRGAGTLTYQWQRSAADSDASYSNIDGATTFSYEDSGAPDNGDGRYFRCVLNASGAAQQISSSDRGFEGFISVSIDPNGVVSYGNVPLNSEKDTTASGTNETKTARNDGNVAENFNIKTSHAVGGTQWSVGGTAGVNTFVHSFSINDGTSWEILQTYDSYETLAVNVSSSGTQDFDLKIGTPVSTSDYQQKTATVTVQAVEY
ncbi:MAG: hypothetical protein QG620_325 [Patescibacteria group bacterium]|nr:hypothetical protein [Patescibacteria group bacterium]